jgi:hypothetical protein
MQPEVGGGLPPFGQDFNGIMLTLSQHIYALQAGQPYLFSATFTGSISGYAAGAILGMADGSGLWLNISGGNETNPDNDSTAANWVPAVSYGLSTLTGLTGGTVTVAPSKWRKGIIELAGALTSNLTVILPPNVQQWLIVNNTTGAFSTTVQTATGTGVTVPQGGPSSPTGVWGDGDNIYLSQAPLSVPISQAATPLTLAERTNSGYIFATYFNQSSSLETPTIGAVVVQNTAADGYFRKISLANFLAAIFDSPVFTAIPEAPTAAAGTSTAQLATTEFVVPGSNLNGTGHRKNADQSITQWGSAAYSGSGTTLVIPFDIPFQTGCFNVICSLNISGYNAGVAAGPGQKNSWTADTTRLVGTAATIFWKAEGV